MKREKVNNKPFYFLSGPMTGYVNFNYDVFDTAASELRSQGYDILNPAELDVDTNDYKSCLRASLKYILDPNCVGLICLNGWEKSFGARAVEVYNAAWLGLSLFSYPEKNVLVELDITKLIGD